MYEQHFGISAPPFQLSPDPSFYFASRGHRETLAALRDALTDPAGHVVVSGEVGAGKTLLVAALVAGLDAARIAVGRLVSTQLDADGLLRATVNAFGAERRKVDRGDGDGAGPMPAFDAFLTRLDRERRRAVLIVDEAQNLDAAAWRRLVEMATRPAAPAGTLTLFLVGQPELRAILADPANAELARRTAMQRHLGPLGAMETGAYIAHRLDHVGWSGRPQFAADAIDAIHRWTGGVPRRINQLCNRLMLAAFLEGHERIDGALVDTVAQELRAELGESTLVAPAVAHEQDAAGSGPAPAPEKRKRRAKRASPPEGKAPDPSEGRAPDPPEGRAPDSPEAAAQPPTAVPRAAAPATDAAAPQAAVPPAADDGSASAPAPALDLVIPEGPMADSTPSPRKEFRSAARDSATPAPTAPARPPPAPPAGSAASLSLNLLPLDDASPFRVIAPVVQFPAYAPWPTLPPAAPAVPRAADAPAPPPAAGPLLCVAGGISDHVQAAALLRTLAAHRELPPARLVRAFANDLVERCASMFRSADAQEAIALGVAPGGSAADRAAELMARFDQVLEATQPTAVIVFDGHEAALAAALAASRRGVQLLRVGAGRRRNDQAGNGTALTRKLSEQVADMLYTADPLATKQLVADGLPNARISTVGSVFADALQLGLREHAVAGGQSEVDAFVAQIAGERGGYGVAVVEGRGHVHDRRTLEELVALLAHVSSDLALVWPMRSATREQLLHLRLDAVIDRARIVCVPPQAYPAFARLMADATCVLTDSWTVQEEATALEVPCLTIGTEPGQPVTIEEGTNRFVGLDRNAATRAVWQCIFNGGSPPPPPRLWDGRAAERIATHLAGYLTRARPGKA